jgi:hypothetical protein
MHHEIKWENDLKTGLARAGTEKKFVLLDFFNPG